MPVNLFAMIWRFAEATLFFIVSDVWLTVVRRDKQMRALFFINIDAGTIPADPGIVFHNI